MKPPEAWAECRLGDCLHVRHGYAFKGEFFTSEPTGKVVLTPGNFYDEGGFKRTSGKEKYYAEVPPDEFVLKQGDLVVAMTEQVHGLLGSTALIPDGDQYLHNQRIGLIEVTHPERLDKRFAYYLFNTPAVRNQIQATATGAKVRHTAPSRIEAVTVALPPLAIQRQVALLLSRYDDLMESNMRRIQVLEEMVQAIYREWFIEFRFPGHEATQLVESELGPVPEGWSVSTLGQVLALLESGSRPAGGIDTTQRDVPSIGAENVIGLGKYDFGKEKFVSRKFFDAMRRGHVADGDVLLYKDGAKIGRKSLAMSGFPHVECAINEHVFRMRAAERTMSPASLYFWLDRPDVTQRVVDLNSNAAQPGISQAKLVTLPILVPDPDVEGQFTRLANDLLGLIFNLAQSNKNLRATRDVLLPRLTLGKVDVSKLDIDISEVVA